MSEKKVSTFSITPDTKTKLRYMSFREETSMSECVDIAVNYYVRQNYEKEVKE